MSVYILPGNTIVSEKSTEAIEKTKKKNIYDIALKDEREMKRICSFGFHEKDGSPHICKVNCECEFATFGICNEDGSYGYGSKTL
jgi:hypothetical protein